MNIEEYVQFKKMIYLILIITTPFRAQVDNVRENEWIKT